MLTSNVAKRRLYQRQQGKKESKLEGNRNLLTDTHIHALLNKNTDTLIVWTEDDNRDLALSFQDPIGCEEMW